MKEENENMQEQLIMKLQEAEAKIERMQSKRHDSDPLMESQVIDDSMTLEMKQFATIPQPTAIVTQEAPLHWEMEQARLNVSQCFIFLW